MNLEKHNFQKLETSNTILTNFLGVSNPYIQSVRRIQDLIEYRLSQKILIFSLVVILIPSIVIVYAVSNVVTQTDTFPLNISAKLPQKTVSTSFVLSDSAIVNLKTASDSFILADKVSRSKRAADVIAITDSSARPQNSVSDIISLDSKVSRDKRAKDSLGLVISATNPLGMVLDTLQISASAKNPQISVTDIPQLLDSVVNPQRSVFDIVSIIDFTGRNFISSLSEVVSITEAEVSTVGRGLMASLSEVVNITMSLTSITNSSGNNVQHPSNNTSGGDTGDRTPPSFTGSMFSDSEYPLTINGKGISLPSHSNPIETKILTIGSEVHVSLLLYDNSGPSNIQHVGLFTNLNGQKKEKSDSDTYILYEKNQPLQINDPNHFFSDAKALASIVENKLQLDFVITFAKPMEKSDIILDVWDYKRNDQQTKIIGAWQVLENQGETSPSDNTGIIQNDQMPDKPKVSESEQDKLILSIKEWAGYSGKSISDAQLLESMGLNGQHIPSWVMKITKWVIDGEISLKDFINTINYLHYKGMIK